MAEAIPNHKLKLRFSKNRCRVFILAWQRFLLWAVCHPIKIWRFHRLRHCHLRSGQLGPSIIIGIESEPTKLAYFFATFLASSTMKTSCIPKYLHLTYCRNFTSIVRLKNKPYQTCISKKRIFSIQDCSQGFEQLGLDDKSSHSWRYSPWVMLWIILPFP